MLLGLISSHYDSVHSRLEEDSLEFSSLWPTQLAPNAAANTAGGLVSPRSPLPWSPNGVSSIENSEMHEGFNLGASVIEDSWLKVHATIEHSHDVEKLSHKHSSKCSSSEAKELHHPQHTAGRPLEMQTIPEVENRETESAKEEAAVNEGPDGIVVGSGVISPPEGEDHHKRREGLPSVLAHWPVVGEFRRRGGLGGGHMKRSSSTIQMQYGLKEGEEGIEELNAEENTGNNSEEKEEREKSELYDRQSRSRYEF